MREVPDPVPGPGEVLLEVHAAGLNNADLLQRRGLYPPPAGASDVPGLEVAAVVAAVGPPDDAAPGDTPTPAPGDRVVALLPGGGYAERAVVDAGLTLPWPEHLSAAEAAVLPEALATAWSNLEVAHARPGERLLVRGGSGGVGTLAVQLGRALGLEVLATAGGPDRVARVRDLGVPTVLDHRADELVEQVLTATGGAGVDVVLDVVGAAALADNLAVLAPDGRLVVIGLQGGTRAELDLGLLLSRRLSVAGTSLRSRPLAQRRAVVAGLRAHVWPHVVDDTLRPCLHAALPLDRADEAHRTLEAGGVFGSLALEV